MNRKQPHHVIVHNVSEEHQKEHKSHLDEALLEAHAEIAAADALQCEQQDVSAIKDGNGKKIENAEVQAEHSHEGDNGKRSFLHRLPCFRADPDDALELLDGDVAGAQFPPDLEDL